MTVDTKMASIERNKPIRERGKTGNTNKDGEKTEIPRIANHSERDPFPHISEREK